MVGAVPMDEIVARCQSCGYEDPAIFSSCPVCHGPSSWWCGPCGSWCASRKCLTCGGLLIVPTEIELGSFPPGTRVPVNFKVRNPGNRSIEVAITSANAALSLLTRRLNLRSGEVGSVVGAVAIGFVPPGPRYYRIRFETQTPVETNLSVEVIRALVCAEFVPSEIVVPGVLPGATVHRSLTLRNTGNVSATALITTTESWLSTQPESISLMPGESCHMKVLARTRKTDFGNLSGQIRVELLEGYSGFAQVHLQLPEPKLEALPVNFGVVTPDLPSYQTVTLKNLGKVRVSCRLAADQYWLAVSPNRVNLPVGGEKEVKLRAVIPKEDAGPKSGSLVALFNGGELLRVPVSILCHVPKPVLGSIRKQTLGSIAADETVVRRFGVSNTGDGHLKCTISANQPWIEILTQEISVAAGKKRRIEYRIDTPALRLGVHQATIHIRSNGGEADVPLSVVVVHPQPKLDFFGDLELGTITAHDTAGGHFSVRNSGVGLLKLRITPEDTRVKVNPSELTLAPGPPTKLAVEVPLDGLTGGNHSYAIHLTGNGGSAYANFHFRLPIEKICAPSEVDLGEQLVEHSAIEAVNLLNTSPDDIQLSIRAEDHWIQPQLDSIAIKSGQIVSIPFRIHLQQGASGPAATSIWIEGRTIRHRIAIHAVARRIELVANPATIDLKKMLPGEERPLVFEVSNRGDMVAEISDLHIPGDLEIWIRRQSIQPGATATLIGRIRMNSYATGKQIGAEVRLDAETVVSLTVQVDQQRRLVSLSTLAGVASLFAGALLWAVENWGIGVVVATLGLVTGFTIWAFGKSK